MWHSTCQFWLATFQRLKIYWWQLVPTLDSPSVSNNRGVMREMFRRTVSRRVQVVILGGGESAVMFTFSCMFFLVFVFMKMTMCEYRKIKPGAVWRNREGHLLHFLNMRQPSWSRPMFLLKTMHPGGDAAPSPVCMYTRMCIPWLNCRVQVIAAKWTSSSQAMLPQNALV